MNSERIDDLLATAFATGRIPEDASASERAEVERLLAGASELRAMRAATAEEALASRPIARARFERFMTEAASAARPVPTQMRAEGLLVRLFGGRGRLRSVAVAAAVAVLAVGGVFLSQSWRGVETANAQVLAPGSYVQAQGVVSEVSGEGANRRIRVQSEWGSMLVSLEAIPAGAGDTANLVPGDAVMIDGTVGADRLVGATNIAKLEGKAVRPAVVKFKELREATPGLIGKVVTLTVSSDSRKGQVLIDAGGGRRFIVNVDVASAADLLEQFGTALGARVEVTQQPGAAAGVFVLRIVGEATPQRPAIQPTIRGIVTGRQANVLHVRTDKGPIAVVVKASTRILLGRSKLTLDGLLRGETSIGHQVSVTGRLDQSTGQVIAEVIVLGPKPAQHIPAPEQPAADAMVLAGAR